MLREVLEALVGGLCIIWVAGSVLITWMKPWAHFDPADRWVAWALMLGWPLIAFAMAIELWIEIRLDRRDARRARRKAREARGRDAV